MGSKHTKLNERFSIIDFPVTFAEMVAISKDLPKTERKFYEYAFNALKKNIKQKELIYSFEVADPKLTKTGFIVVAENKLHFVMMKSGLFGEADAESLEYKDIKDVDFDIIRGPLGISLMHTGIIELKVKKMFGTKTRTIRNIPEYNLDLVVEAIRQRL
ncbi:hypothetical protein BAMA_18280 [Bacillus manliponensis]|uniref:YokE-like PH domain-containing protein n=1 Tax=Bacillus manliponensis TaxID=574376 RepID=A0A073JSB4_9BACI|nr:PH domain-containing protein [Bacillus manliponensis]KEK17157.1 hypothetical protein BAMA_18280 [Bacillus manliponensis]